MTSRALADGKPGPGRVVIGQGDIHVLRGDHARPTGLELLGPLELALGLFELGLGLQDVGLGSGDASLSLIDAGLEKRCIKPSQDGPLLYLRAIADRFGGVGRIDAEALDPAGDLGADVNNLLGLDGSRGVDGGFEHRLCGRSRCGM